METGSGTMRFEEAVAGLLAGDFTRLDPLFERRMGDRCSLIEEWHEKGLFKERRDALQEALTCACFNGRVTAAEALIANGVEVSGGIGTGLNAVHWAVNRGQLEAVRLLLRHKAPLETLNSYGGTVLGCAVWSAMNEPKVKHPEIIEELIQAGAKTDVLKFPTGDPGVDQVLKSYCERR